MRKSFMLQGMPPFKTRHVIEKVWWFSSPFFCADEKISNPKVPKVQKWRLDKNNPSNQIQWNPSDWLGFPNSTPRSLLKAQKFHPPTNYIAMNQPQPFCSFPMFFIASNGAGRACFIMCFFWPRKILCNIPTMIYAVRGELLSKITQNFSPVFVGDVCSSFSPYV